MNIFFIQSIKKDPGRINQIFDSLLMIGVQIKYSISKGKKSVCDGNYTTILRKMPTNRINTDFIHSPYSIYAFAMLYPYTIHIISSKLSRPCLVLK